MKFGQAIHIFLNDNEKTCFVAGKLLYFVFPDVKTRDWIRKGIDCEYIRSITGRVDEPTDCC